MSRNVTLRQKTDRLNLFYILEQQAYNKKFENSIALIFDDRKWTYKHLYNTALKYGTWLKTTYGIKPKDIIAVNFENSEKFIFIWFGLWSIGARAALLNCHLRGKALVHCIRVSTTSLVLMDPNIIENLTDEVRKELPNVKFVTLTSELESDAMTFVAVREPDSVRSDSKKQKMGMLVFTSGTTGLPKPTIVSWSKCYSGADIFRKWIGIRSSDVVYTVGIPFPFSFILLTV
jgi:acyl-CoA synthetase (AMP-forming)/AMP-acid ligase II